MASFNKFNDFVEQLCRGVHQLQSGGHTLKVYLSNEAPLATDTVKADIVEITAQNGYPAGGADIQNDCSETGGTLTVTAQDVVFTASGGSFGPFRYAVIYNDTPTSPADPLVGWYDYGSSITVLDGETFTVDFGSSLLVWPSNGAVIQSGAITLLGQDGVTVTHNHGSTSYLVKTNVTGLGNLGRIGDIAYVKAANTVVIYNSGISGISADVEISAVA